MGGGGGGGGPAPLSRPPMSGRPSLDARGRDLGGYRSAPRGLRPPPQRSGSFSEPPPRSYFDFPRRDDAPQQQRRRGMMDGGGGGGSRSRGPSPPAHAKPPLSQQQQRPRGASGGYVGANSPRGGSSGFAWSAGDGVSASAYGAAPHRPSSMILTPLNIPRRTPRPLPSIDTLDGSGTPMATVTPTAGGLIRRQPAPGGTGGAPSAGGGGEVGAELPPKETIIQCMDKIDAECEGVLEDLEDAKNELERVKRAQSARARKKKTRLEEIEARRSSITERPPTLFLTSWSALASKSCSDCVSVVYAENAETLLTAGIHDETRTAAMLVRAADDGRLLERVIAAATVLGESKKREGAAPDHSGRTSAAMVGTSTTLKKAACGEVEWWEDDAATRRRASEVRHIALQLRDGHTAVPLTGGRVGKRWVPLASAPLLSTAAKIAERRSAYEAKGTTVDAMETDNATPAPASAPASAPAATPVLPSRRFLAREMLTLRAATSSERSEGFAEPCEACSYSVDDAMHRAQRSAVQRVIAQRKRAAWDEEQLLVDEFMTIRVKYEMQGLSARRGGRSRLRAGVGRRQSKTSSEMLLETHRHAEAALADEQESLRLMKEASIASATAQEAAQALAASNIERSASGGGRGVDPGLESVAIATAAAAAAFEAAAAAAGEAGSKSGSSSRGPRSRLLNRLGIGGSTGGDATSELVAAAKKEERAWKKRLLGAIEEVKIPPMGLSKGRVWRRYPICFSLVSEAIECRDLPIGVPCPPMCRCPQSAANEQRRAAEWTDIEKCIFIDKFMQVRACAPQTVLLSARSTSPPLVSAGRMSSRGRPPGQFLHVLTCF